jgi:beta-N-acetylhexosaminidase
MTFSDDFRLGTVADPHLLLAFDGTDIPGWLGQRLRDEPPSGVTLFRELNSTSPDQVAQMTSDLQRLNASDIPLLIAIDQEGGQLLGLVGSTPFAGNMALGATGDADLTYRVAHAMGVELAAVGVNVNYAPVVDVATEPSNPSLGVRSLGDDPHAVAMLSEAFVRGFEDAGIRTSAKHFPGKGEAAVDPHYELPVLGMTRERFDSVELAPFKAAFAAGASLLMVGHYVAPALTGDNDTPIPASYRAITEVLRGDLGFSGLVVTDALDMGALDQGETQVVEIIAMMRAGVDLLLCMPDRSLETRVRAAVNRGYARGLISQETLSTSRKRIAEVRRSTRIGQLDPSAVSSAEHRAVADELAERSITLVRNDAGVLPLTVSPDSRILCVEPTPTNVTPADTTALYPASLADSVAAVHPDVVGIVYPHLPAGSDIHGIVSAASDVDVVIVGTVAAGSEQAALVNALIATGKPVVTVAMRTPFDLAHYPDATTHICTYSSLEPSVRALVSAMFGRTTFTGRLPAAIPGLYPTGHGSSL